MKSAPGDSASTLPRLPAAEELLPLVYEELRRLASSRMARQFPGQTLQATALVPSVCSVYFVVPTLLSKIKGGPADRRWRMRRLTL